MKELTDIIEEIRQICDANPVMDDRLQALRDTGYPDIEFRYLKQSRMIHYGKPNGLLSTAFLKRKKVYRIQVSPYELQKGYNAAWCVDVPMQDVEFVEVLKNNLKEKHTTDGITMEL